jgi:prepilin-type N-terminal cleavage/methylation domain-containing protein
MKEQNRTCMHTRGGMTLVEILIAVAIVSILSGIVFASISTVRTQSRIKSAENLMESVRTTAVACISRGEALSDRVVNDPMCGTNSLRWPRLPHGWVYDTPTAVAGDVATRTFTFSITGDGKTVTCDEVACTTS